MASQPTLNLTNIDRGVFHVSYAHGYLFMADHSDLLKELGSIRDNNFLLSGEHQKAILNRFITYLEEDLTDDKFKGHFHAPSKLSIEGKKTLSTVTKLAETFLTRKYLFEYDNASFKDLMAFQHIVTTIHEYVLKQLTLNTVVCPLARWGGYRRDDQDSGIHLSPKDQLSLTIENEHIKIDADVVSLPFIYKNHGLCAWSLFGHEVGGHGILNTFPEILKKLKKAVQDMDKPNFIDENEEHFYAYLTDDKRLEEIISDVIGTLVSGIAFEIGLFSYLKGLNRRGLSNFGFNNSDHPPQALRFFGIAKIIDMLKGSKQESSEIKNLVRSGLSEDKFIIHEKIGATSCKSVCEVDNGFAIEAMEKIAERIARVQIDEFGNRTLLNRDQLDVLGSIKEYDTQGIQIRHPPFKSPKSSGEKKKTRISSAICCASKKEQDFSSEDEDPGSFEGVGARIEKIPTLGYRSLMNCFSWNSYDDDIVSIVKDSIGKKENTQIPFLPPKEKEPSLLRQFSVWGLDTHKILSKKPLPTLEERRINELDLDTRKILPQGDPEFIDRPLPCLGRHIITAGILETLEDKADLDVIFINMKQYLYQSSIQTS